MNFRPFAWVQADPGMFFVSNNVGYMITGAYAASAQKTVIQYVRVKDGCVLESTDHLLLAALANGGAVWDYAS